ncbi:MAG: proteasome subunit beta [Candidatus Aenigmatarchaeota archaeon]|nr:MAG: proteasome subunit beta [Candidatus Aenigmarchaeota archaeon]
MTDQMESKKTGTTNVVIRYNGGIVLGAEKKVTMGYLVDGTHVRKVYPIDEHIAMTIAGMVGDLQSIVRYLRAEVKLYKLQKGERIGVRSAATLLANILQGAKYFPYMGQFLLAGVDNKGPQLYSLDAYGGVVDGEDYLAAGSGMPYALGVLEDQYKSNITRDQGITLTLKALRAATKRDIASGGDGFTIIVIDETGSKELSEKEIDSYLK